MLYICGIFWGCCIYTIVIVIFNLFSPFAYIGPLLNLFWVDPISIVDYKSFGDAITFDTTYKSNKYNLSLDLFCGTNNHQSTVIFTIGVCRRRILPHLFDCSILLKNAWDQLQLLWLQIRIKVVLLVIFHSTFHRVYQNNKQDGR